MKKHKPLNPWLTTRTRSGAEYDAPYEIRAQAGLDIHGEANLVQRLLANYLPQDNHAHLPYQVLDAGCGTGRMAIELGRRGFDVIGVDLDEVMLTQAQAKAPQMNWVLGDLSTVKIERRFDIIVLAGNVMIYLTPQTEKAVLLNMAAHLKAGGLLLAAFELNPYPWTNLTIEGYEQLTKAAGFREVARWSNWDQAAWQQGDGYVVYLTKK